MKKILLSLFILTLSSVYAQQDVPPQGINYQAVVYTDEEYSVPGANPIDVPISNREIDVRFSIYTGATQNDLLYSEIHTTTTDKYGMISVVIGNGTPETSTLFETIDWTGSDHFLRVSINKNEGATFQPISFQKLWSVPYALYSGVSKSSEYSDSSAYSSLSGNGLTGVIDNGDGTLTFEYFNGSSFTTGVLSNLQGPQGPAGADGQDGAQGLQGPQGADGQDGADGLSAYEVWLNQGNTGSEQDYLNSLVGPPGNPGSSNIQMIHGTCSGGFNPTVINGSGFSVTHVNTGRYNVIFDTPFNSIPSIICSLTNFDTSYLSQQEWLKVRDVTINGFTIYTMIGGTLNAVPVNFMPFTFLAIVN